MGDCLLSLNAGSSSLKFALFQQAGNGTLEPLLRGQLKTSTTEVHLQASRTHGGPLTGMSWSAGQGGDVLRLLQWIRTTAGGGEIAAVGHRIVHGGGKFTQPVIATADIVARIQAITPLAPLHQPLGLAPLIELRGDEPELTQVCCFDTAFHHGLAPPVSRYGIPREWELAGIRRYGFHGLSYQSIVDQLSDHWPELAAGRVVVAHLGSGASLCALSNCKSMDTTMGFSALDGLLMGTRPGSIDPGVILHLLRSGLSTDDLEHLLYHESGLLGVSGISSDIRDLLASDAPSAREAVELFVFRSARETAALAATLGGLDGVVFTGGIGEHNSTIRQMVCDRLGWLGVRVDPEANAAGLQIVSQAQSSVTVMALATDEEKVIARSCSAALEERQHPNGPEG